MKKIVLIILNLFILISIGFALSPNSIPNKIKEIFGERSFYWIEYLSNDFNLRILENILSPKVLDVTSLKLISDFGGYAFVYVDPKKPNNIYKVTKSKNLNIRLKFNLINLHEAKILLSLNKMNIKHIPILNEVGINLDGNIWMSMQEIPNLEQLSLDSIYWKYLPKDKKVNLLIRIANVFNEIHQKGYIHGDIKPPNILINQNDFLIIDFGISKAIENKMHIKSDILFFSYILEQFLIGFKFSGKNSGFETKEIIDSGIKALVDDLQKEIFKTHINMSYVIDKLKIAEKYFISKTKIYTFKKRIPQNISA